MDMMKKLAGMATALLCTASLAAPEAAEFALRWDGGGPMTADEVVRALKLDGHKPKKTKYTVEYFNFGAAPSLSKDETAIGRLRKSDDGGKSKLTYKTRTPHLAATAWTCPLPGGKDKTEVDVTLLRGTDVRRVLSRSCDAEPGVLAFPAALQARSRGCANAMTRIELKKVPVKGVTVEEVTVEEWQTPRGRLLEVSMRGTNDQAHLDLFRHLVGPVLGLEKLRLLDRSKTEAGSECA
jgi:hypothetical protein